FFFSSRRRHTRSKRDWSSDVCSSDLKDNILFAFLSTSSFARFSASLIMTALSCVNSFSTRLKIICFALSLVYQPLRANSDSCSATQSSICFYVSSICCCFSVSDCSLCSKNNSRLSSVTLFLSRFSSFCIKRSSFFCVSTRRSRNSSSSCCSRLLFSYFFSWIASFFLYFSFFFYLSS